MLRFNSYASCFPEQVCSAILAITFLSICGLSIAALVGLGQYWTYYTYNKSDPGAYNIECAFLYAKLPLMSAAAVPTLSACMSVLLQVWVAALQDQGHWQRQPISKYYTPCS